MCIRDSGTMCQIFYAIAQKKLMQKIVSCSYQQWNISLVMRMKIQWNHTMAVSYTHLDVYKRQATDTEQSDLEPENGTPSAPSCCRQPCRESSQVLSLQSAE